MDPIADTVVGVVSSALGPLLSRLIDLIPDPAEKARQAAIAQQQLMAADAAIIAAQNATNLAEAQNKNLFVSGWRPFVGWVCGAGLAWQVVFEPFLAFGLNAFGYHPTLPQIDSGWITALLIPLLGLGAMKSVERIYGVSNEGQSPSQTVVMVPHQSTLALPSAYTPGLVPVQAVGDRMQPVLGEQHG